MLAREFLIIACAVYHIGLCVANDEDTENFQITKTRRISSDEDTENSHTKHYDDSQAFIQDRYMKHEKVERKWSIITMVTLSLIVIVVSFVYIYWQKRRNSVELQNQTVSVIPTRSPQPYRLIYPDRQNTALSELIEAEEKKDYEDEAGINQETEIQEMDEYKACEREMNVNNDDIGKKPLSSFFLFKKAVREQTKSEFPGKSEKEIVKEIGKKWRALSQEEKKPYEDEAARLRQQYNLYVSLPPKPKDDKCPKQPLNSFFLYQKAMREQMNAEFPDKSTQEISKELGKKWKALSKAEKKAYEDKAARLMQQYRSDMAKYEGSDAHKEYQRKLKQWEIECDQRKRRK